MVSQSLTKARYNWWQGMLFCSLLFLGFSNFGAIITYTLTRDSRQLIGFGVSGFFAVILGFLSLWKSDRYYRLYVGAIDEGNVTRQ